jgi:tetratricopeptide (TPR) repeat protein
MKAVEKIILVLFSFLFVSNTVFGGGNYQTTDSRTPTDFMYQPPWQLAQQALQKKEELYNYNKQYLDNLINWAVQLLNQINETEFRDRVSPLLWELMSFNGQDYSLLSNEIRQVQLSIQADVENYNERVKAATKPVDYNLGNNAYASNPSVKAATKPVDYWEIANEKLKDESYTEAIENYNLVIQASPNFALAYFFRGKAYEMNNNYSMAIDDYSKCIQLKPTSSAVYGRRGCLKSYLKDYLGALSDFNKQIELEGNATAQEYFYRGLCKSNIKDYYGAMKDNEKAIEIDSKFSRAYNNLAWSKFNLNRFSEALVDVNKAIELDSSDFGAYDSRAEIKFNLKDYKGCITDCDNALSLNYNIPNSYFLKGRAFYRLGNKEKACELWRYAQEVGDPDARGKTEASEYILKYCNK